MRLQRLLAGGALGAGAALLALALTELPGVRRMFEPLELLTVDLRTRASAAPPRERSPVVLLLLDSASVQEWPYLSPFPRAVLADLIEVATAGGARAVGLDVDLDRRYPRLDSLDRGDERLRAAIGAAGNVVLAARSVGTGTERRVLYPDPYFAEVAAGVGVADLPTPYETVRDVVLSVRAGERLAPGFALALYARARGLAADTLLARSDAEGRLRVPDLPERYARLPRGAAVQTAPILFVGPPSRAGSEAGAFVAVSASHAAFFPEMLRDRVVLIGSGFHADDAFRTPFYEKPDGEGGIFGWTYGVEVHANALENLLSGRFPRPLGTPRAVALLLIYGLLVTGLTFWGGTLWGAGGALVLLAGHVVAAFALFADASLVLPVVAPALGLGLSLFGSTAFVSLVEGREKRQIRRAFRQYVSPAVVDQLVANPAALRLGGEKRPTTILFSDLAGFTSLSEVTDPERLLGLLNEYLDEMTNLVLDHGGTLDKYIGDAVMALYGVPAPLPEHAARACETALRMQQRLRELNHRWTAEGWPELKMRIGINSGVPVVGNIGGSRHFDYTALGDAVNLAARLEPACKTYGVGILISEETRRAAGAAVVVRELGSLGVYGRRGAMPVYELVAMAGEEEAATRQLLDRFADGLAAYGRRDFTHALCCFGAAAALDPQDEPTRFYQERCRTYLVTPPPSDWDPVERLQSK